MSRRRLYLKHVASYFGSFGWRTFVNLGLLSFLRLKLGDEGVGVWSIAFSLGSYMGLVDLNTHSSVTKYVAELEAQGRSQDLAPLVGTALRLLGGLSFGMLALALLALPWVAPLIFKTQAYPAGDMRLLAALCLLSFACLQTGNVFQQVLAGLLRQHEVNLIGSFGVTLNAVLVVAVVLAKMPLWGLGAANLLNVLILLGVTRWRVARLRPGLPLFGGAFDRPWFDRLWNFSLAGYAFTIWGWVYFMAPKMLLANRLGPVWVAYYEYATKLGFLGRNVVQMLSQYLLPFISELQALGEKARARALMLRVLGLLWMGGLAWGAFQASLGRPLMALWLGPTDPAVLVATFWVAIEFTLAGLVMPLVHFAFAEADFRHTRPFLYWSVPTALLGPWLGLVFGQALFGGAFEGFLIVGTLATAVGTAIFYVVALRHRGIDLVAFAGLSARALAASALAAMAAWNGAAWAGPRAAELIGRVPILVGRLASVGRWPAAVDLGMGALAFVAAMIAAWGGLGLLRLMDFRSGRPA